MKNPSFEVKRYIVKKWVGEINIQDDGSIKINVRIPQGEVLGESKKDMTYDYDSSRGIQLAPQINLKFEEVINLK